MLPSDIPPLDRNDVLLLVSKYRYMTIDDIIELVERALGKKISNNEVDNYLYIISIHLSYFEEEIKIIDVKNLDENTSTFKLNAKGAEAKDSLIKSVIVKQSPHMTPVR